MAQGIGLMPEATKLVEQKEEPGPIQEASTKLVLFCLALGHMASSLFCIFMLILAFWQFALAGYVYWGVDDSLPDVLYKLTGGVELLFFAPIPMLLMFAILDVAKNKDEKELINLKVSVAALLSAIAAASLTGEILKDSDDYVMVAIKGGALIVLALYTFIMSISLKKRD